MFGVLSTKKCPFGDLETDGDYISYMTDETKDTRREEWKKRNFAGSIDWAVDLQSFTDDEYDESLERPKSNVGCVWGDDMSLGSGSLCAFSCMYGFCPESLCECVDEGEMETLPAKQTGIDVTAYDLSNYDYCPDDICIKSIQEIDDGIVEVGDVEGVMNRTEIVIENQARCMIFEDGRNQAHEMEACKKVCKDKIEAAQEDGRTTDYGCMGFWPGQKTITWKQAPGGPAMTPGRCLCDNWVLNELADTVLEALPMIAQIGCYIIMSSLKLVLDLSAQFTLVQVRLLTQVWTWLQQLRKWPRISIPKKKILSAPSAGG
ncbi:hypothetical protein N0V95_005931 [Ascochyta clinopodiicola]|nr:hypothetical protein N0V95_005931 [Ascochyta clinopodiicola]